MFPCALVVVAVRGVIVIVRVEVLVTVLVSIAGSPQAVTVHAFMEVCMLVAVSSHTALVSVCVIVAVDVLIGVGLLRLCLVYGVGW